MEKSDSSSSNVGVIVPTDGSQIPKESVLLTPMQAYRLRMRQFKSWDKPSEVWPIVFGPLIGATAGLVSGFTISFYARQMFQLYSQRYFWPILAPIFVFTPSSFWVLFDELVTKAVVLERSSHTGCDNCLKLRAAVIQAGCSTVLPFGLSFLTCSIASVTDRTYPVPSITDYRGLLATVKRFGRSLRLTGSVLLLANGLIGAGLAHLMIKANRCAMDKQVKGTGSLTTYPPVSN